MGIALRPAGFAAPALGVLNTAGTLWMNALRMLALPLAVANTLCVVTRERSSRAAGQIGGAIGIYIVLLLAAAGAVLLVVPPILHSTPVDRAAVEVAAQSPTRPATPASPPSTADSIAALMPRNLAKAVVNEDFLPLLIFSFLFGMALRKNSAGAGGAVIRVFEGVTEALMVMVGWCIRCAPAAMFALAAVFAANHGTRLAGILGEFVLLECGLMLAFVLLLYPLTALAGGVSLRAFAAAALEPQMVAVSTRSSLASLPALLVAGEKLSPANPEPSRMLLPVAVSIFKVNRSATALCRVLVILYFWQVAASPWQILVFVLTVVLLSFSELGIPGGTQLRTLPAYLAAGRPIEAVMLLEVIEPLSDIAKTLLNFTGDLSIAAIVTRWSQPSLAGCAAAVEQPAGS